jgi:acetyl esterase/lipase
MVSKHYKTFFVFLLIHIFCLSNNASAQCTGRYLDSTSFSSVDSFQNIIYTTTAGGGTDTELLDIYQPHGDTACLRHLIIFMHGGAFFQGTKNDGDIEFFAYHMAKRGYVCASINYRLASSIIDLYDSTQIFKYAYYGFSDLKAAIRYFYQSAAQSNHWNIDTSAIFVAGSSAGGIDADFVTSLDSVGQLVPAFQTIANANGGIDGNSGNLGYSTRVIGAASLAGAVYSVNWITSSAPPTIFCQGTADGTVPYDCGNSLTQYIGRLPTINLCGSGEMAPRFDSLGIRYSLLPFPGSGHVPWDTNVVIAHRTDSAVAAFFYSVNCTQATGHCNQPLGISNIESTNQLAVYPNPASNYIQIVVQDQNELAEYSLSDYTSREVLRSTAKGKQTTLSVRGLAPGLYLLRIYLADRDSPPLTRKIIIE